MKRPPEAFCRSHAMFASTMGLRAKAMAMAVPSPRREDVGGGDGEGQERVVLGLGGPEGAEAEILRLPRIGRNVAEVEGEEAGVESHEEASAVRPSRVRGSRKSRTASPTRLRASTITKIATPGSSTTCGLRITNCRPVASMLPQSAVGGWVPSPRKDSPAVVRILAPTSRLKATTTGESRCGTTWRARISRSGLPSARAASTNSRSRTESTTPRTRRA